MFLSLCKDNSIVFLKRKKLHINLKFLSPLILLILFSCGSFESSSLVSSDGIYDGKKSNFETIKPKSDYFKNYFSDEADKYSFDLSQNDSLNLDSYLISSDEIAYTENNPSWGDIPTSVDYIIDYTGYNYRNRFFSPYFSYYDPYYRYNYPFSLIPYPYRYSFLGFYPYINYGYYSPYHFYAFNSPYFSNYNRWGARNWYGNYYNYSIYEKYNDMDSKVSYNKGRRGSSSNVVVYSNGRSSIATNENKPDVRNYNQTRQTLEKIANNRKSGAEKTRNYFDPRLNNLNGSKNLRNYAKSAGVTEKGSNRTIKTPSKRYYNDPYKSNTSSTWGLSGRSNNSNYSNSTSRNSRSSSNWTNPSSSTRSSNSSVGGRSYNYSSSSSSSGSSTSSSIGRSSSSSSRTGGIRN